MNKGIQKVKKYFSIILIFQVVLINAQISGDIVGTSVISGQTQFVKINPNTGFVTVIGNQTNPIYGSAFINIGNAAYDCNNNNYTFGANYTSQNLLLTINKSTGNIISTFGYQIVGLSFNQNNGLYYGLEYNTSGSGSFKLVSFDPVSGSKNAITTSTIANVMYLYPTNGFTLDQNNNKYIFIYGSGSTQKIYSIDITSGSVSFSSINYGSVLAYPLLPILHSNNTNKNYSIIRYQNSGTDSLFFCSITLNGALTRISELPISNLLGFPNGTNNPSSGATINSQAGIYSYIDIQNKLVNIDIYTGTIISNPSISAADGVSYIQYANCNVVGIEEYIDNKKYNLFYPNPTSDKTIFLNGSIINNGENATIKIYNTIGEVVYTKTLSNSNGNDNLILLNNLIQGFYIVEYSSQSRHYSNSLIVK